MLTDFRNLLSRVSQLPGAPGDEGRIRNLLRNYLGDRGSTDHHGNLFFDTQSATKAPRIMLAAHMDEVGMAVQSITSEGMLKFVTLGGIWPASLIGMRVTVCTNDHEIPGVVASKPIHFLSASEREKLPKTESLFVDVGAKDRQEVEETFGIQLGTPIVPYTTFTELFKNDMVMCKAFDDRIGVAQGAMLFSQLQAGEQKVPVTFAATVQEELGCRGARTVCESARPEICFVLEGTPADDLPGTSADERQGVVGEGVQIRLYDPSAMMNRKLANFVIDTAKSCGINHQIAVRRSGGTDASNIHTHGIGVPTVVLGTPARYIHSANAIASLEDCVSGIKLVKEVLNRLSTDTINTLTSFED